ncbi:MAG: PAS domain S-box protein, partial [Bacillati bacterium ANGP1]
MAIMVGVLKRHAARGVEVSRENAVLAEQIGERRRAEEVLQESEARYRTLFENVPVGLCSTTPSGQILDANAALVRILGFPDRDMLLAKNITDTYFDPKDRAQKTAQIAREGAVGKFVAHQMRRYDGAPVWVESSGQANYDPQGRVLYFDGVIVDVTDRKREEETRKRSEEERRKGAERYRSLFNGIPVGLYRAAVGGEILEANPAFLRILGCPDLETLRAMNAEDLYVDSEVRHQWISILEREGVVSGFESRLRRLDGAVIWVLASARIVHGASGEASYLEGAAEDITERKQVQDAVVRAREADRANQAKSEFLSRMSHELRTPLNAILGFGQLLEMDSITPKQHEYVADILKGGHHLLDLINEVLEISRIEAGRLTISPEPVSVQEVAQESFSLIAPLFAQGNIRLEDGTARITEQFVWADRQRLKQVLLNLLSNAVKYNRRGGLVALSCEAMPEGRLRMKVSDTGPGIAPERLERLFVPFERLGAEQTTIEGTGLGLALSKRLTEVMGGTLGVDSTVGRGSTFWIELALSESPAQRESAAMPGETELQAPQTAGTVLYVEDNLPNLKLVQKL